MNAASWKGIDPAVLEAAGATIDPADELDSIFDRYARSADSGGSGLGLAIARNLVEAHGGSIDAESPPDGGATIRVRLPVRD